MKRGAKELSGRRAAGIIGAAALLGSAIGGGVVASASESGGTAKHTAPVSTPGPADFRTNDAGQTIGGMPVGGPLPDLVQVTLPDGTTGYVYSRDMSWPAAKNPDEAVKLMQQHVNSDGDVVATVYAIDGKTVIGSLNLAHVDETPGDTD